MFLEQIGRGSAVSLELRMISSDVLTILRGSTVRYPHPEF
jgi:hypothetical protein